MVDSLAVPQLGDSPDSFLLVDSLAVVQQEDSLTEDLLEGSSAVEDTVLVVKGILRHHQVEGDNHHPH